MPTGSGATVISVLGGIGVKTALRNGWRLIRRVRFTANRDPDPVIASRQQHGTGALKGYA